ncbi:hypothetical protein DOTSEDRAFT_44065 [Dothistroma septosporum NZE10]|uniref:Uncharacterized protein n=1 Tax=Dothistroma septosporum (strain NZE10 / CBS 128990) TaxID=675120 RepID=N1PQU0_DOTSN|nr:hypothetical protein DOTSEDRAFT_44065 [Dothistroma septosporum NZE10]
MNKICSFMALWQICLRGWRAAETREAPRAVTRHNLRHRVSERLPATGHIAPL